MGELNLNVSKSKEAHILIADRGTRNWQRAILYQRGLSIGKGSFHGFFQRVTSRTRTKGGGGQQKLCMQGDIRCNWLVVRSS